MGGRKRHFRMVRLAQQNKGSHPDINAADLQAVNESAVEDPQTVVEAVKTDEDANERAAPAEQPAAEDAAAQPVMADEASLRAELAAATQREAELRLEIAVLQKNFADARAQLQARQVTEQAQQPAQNVHQRELQELRRRSERQHEALSTWEGYRSFTDARLAESAAQLTDADGRNAAALQALQSQCNALQDELVAAREQSAKHAAELAQSQRDAEQARQATAAESRSNADRIGKLTADLAAVQGSLAQTEKELGELRIVEDKARLGAARFDDQMQQIASLLGRIATAKKRQKEAEAQLRKFRERPRGPDVDPHARTTVIDTPDDDAPRARATEDRKPVVQAPEPIAKRVLVRLMDGGAEDVIALGRRTTLGRTPDNDIQIDTHSASRRHAVVLSNTDHCVVEDLNSTNGVMVNGRRSGRHILQDGDILTVGGAEFRYQQRS